MMTYLKTHAVLLGRIAVPLLAVAFWEVSAAAAAGQIAPVWPSLTSLPEAFAEGRLGADVSSTLRSVLTGFAIAAAVGVPLGLALGRSPCLYRTVEPVLSGTAAVPRIVLLPVLLTLLGITDQAKVGMAVLGAIVPITLTSMAGARTVEPALIKLGQSLCMSRLTLLRKVILPSALAPIMAGLRIGFSLALLTVILSEFFAATSGVGLRIQQAYTVQQLPLMYGLVVFVVGFGLVANVGLWMVERRVSR